MKKSLIVTVVIGVIVALCLIGGCSSYNGMVTAEQSVDKQWGNVENAYQRRADLIPNLVNTVKGYAQHESSTLENVTNARAGLTEAYNAAKAAGQTASPADVASFQQAQDKLNGALSFYMNAVHEAYPELKANQNFLSLQAELEQTENRISTERKRYNDVVEAYNVKVLRFPGRLFASMFGFDKREMFKAQEGANRAPEVQF